jgi:hypothetical protein
MDAKSVGTTIAHNTTAAALHTVEFVATSATVTATGVTSFWDGLCEGFDIACAEAELRSQKREAEAAAAAAIAVSQS